MSATDHPGVRRTRLALQAPAQLLAAQAEYATVLADVSMSGARVRRPADWPGNVPSPLRLQVALDEQRAIRVAVRVVRETASELALEFDYLSHADEVLLGELLERQGSPADGLDD